MVGPIRADRQLRRCSKVDLSPVALGHARHRPAHCRRHCRHCTGRRRPAHDGRCGHGAPVAIRAATRSLSQERSGRIRREELVDRDEGAASLGCAADLALEDRSERDQALERVIEIAAVHADKTLAGPEGD